MSSSRLDSLQNHGIPQVVLSRHEISQDDMKFLKTT